MPWTTTFHPFTGKETVGDLTAVFSEPDRPDFVFAGSVNLDIQETVDDFMKRAKAALAEHDALKTTHTNKLEAINDALNT